MNRVEPVALACQSICLSVSPLVQALQVPDGPPALLTCVHYCATAVQPMYLWVDTLAP